MEPDSLDDTYLAIDAALLPGRARSPGEGGGLCICEGAVLVLHTIGVECEGDIEQDASNKGARGVGELCARIAISLEEGQLVLARTREVTTGVPVGLVLQAEPRPTPEERAAMSDRCRR